MFSERATWNQSGVYFAVRSTNITRCSLRDLRHSVRVLYRQRNVEVARGFEGGLSFVVRSSV